MPSFIGSINQKMRQKWKLPKLSLKFRYLAPGDILSFWKIWVGQITDYCTLTVLSCSVLGVHCSSVTVCSVRIRTFSLCECHTYVRWRAYLLNQWKGKNFWKNINDSKLKLHYSGWIGTVGARLFWHPDEKSVGASHRTHWKDNPR